MHYSQNAFLEYDVIIYIVLNVKLSTNCAQLEGLSHQPGGYHKVPRYM